MHTPATEATPDEAEFTPGGAELMAEVASILRIDRLDGWANPPAPAGPPPCFCYTYAPEPGAEPRLAGQGVGVG